MVEEILAWGVIGVVIPMLLGVGVTVVNTRESDDLYIAKTCFVLAGLIGMAKLLQVGLRSGTWDVFPLFALGMTVCFWFCLEASRYVDRKREDKLAKETRTDREGFIIRQLERFVDEERQIRTQETSSLAGGVAGFGQMISFCGKVEHFLGLHLSNEYVARFQKKGVYALQEMIKEFIDGTPIPVSLQPVQIPQTLSAALDEKYELKKLEPSFRDYGSEPVPVKAHDDEKGVIVQGESPNKDTFAVLVRAFGNEHPVKKVRPVKKVSFGLCFICYDADTQHTPIKNVDIHRGAWLSEADTQVDFPANCPPRRTIIATIEGPNNRVYAVRRDSDTSYKNILPVREELTGNLYGVIMPFHIDSKKSGSFHYMLEIVREPKLELRLNDARTWKSINLYNFIAEGYDFAKKIHEVWKDATEKTPLPEVNERSLLGPNISELLARRSAIEREKEEEMFDSIKEWGSRAANWVERFIGPEARDKILKSGPSFEIGLNRGRKSALQLMGPPTRLGKEPPPSPPPLPYWTLSDAVGSRIDALTKIREHLQ